MAAITRPWHLRAAAGSLQPEQAPEGPATAA